MSQFLKFPDAIYAIGGAGKTLVFDMLERDWILKKILEPVEPNSNPNRCEIFVIDTCLDEENDDRKRISNINKKVDEILTEYHESSQNSEVGSISVKYQLLTKNMNLGTALALTGDSVRSKVVNGTDANVWWMSDENIDPDWHTNIMEFENLKTMEFAKGVYRKRAVGKAIFYKALGEENDNFLPKGSNIDIICGIGGGTGSGIAIDLAKKIKSTNHKSTSNINLFGILSTLNESNEEKANCAAMLSELEYLKVSGIKFGELNGKDIFANNILVPIELTNYEGNRVLNPRSRKLLDEFDSVFPNILISYHNTDRAENIFDNQPSFAPFIMAVPQAVRYNVDYIKKVKANISSKMEMKKDSLSNEKKVYERIRSFLDTYYPESTGPHGHRLMNDEDKAFLYENRYLKFREVINIDYFDALQYENILLLKNAIKDIGNTDDEIGIYKKVDEHINHIVSTIEASGLDSNGNLSVGVDNDMYRILLEEVYTIKDIGHLLSRLNTLEDSQVSKMFKKVIKMEDRDLSLMLNQSRNRSEDLQEEMGYLTKGINDLENSISSVEDNSNIQLEEGKKKWDMHNREHFEKLDLLDSSKNNLYSSLDELNRNFDMFVDDINSASLKKIDQISNDGLERSIDIFASQMHLLDLNFNDERILHDVIDVIRDLRRNYRRSKKKVPLTEKLLPGKGPVEKSIDEAKNNVSRIISRWSGIDRVKLELKGEKIVFRYNRVIDDMVESIKGEQIKNIENNLLDEYPGADRDLIFSFIKDLEISNVNMSAVFDTYVAPIIRSNFAIDDKLDKNVVEIRAKKEDHTNVSKEIDKYNALENLIRDVSRYYNDHFKNLNSYHSFVSGDDESISMARIRPMDTESYVVELEPNEISRVLVAGSDINNIMSSSSERNSVLKYLNDLAMNMVNQKYNGLVNLIVQEGTKQWDQMKLNCSFISKVKDLDISDNTAIELRSSFGIEYSALNRWYIEGGDDWSVNLVTFIAGVPIDNIYNYVNAANGYFVKLNDIRDDPDKMSFFHNSALLERGEFIERKQVFDLNNRDRGIFVQEKQGIKDHLEKNFDLIKLSDIARELGPSE